MYPAPMKTLFHRSSRLQILAIKNNEKTAFLQEQFYLADFYELPLPLTYKPEDPSCHRQWTERR